MPDTDIIISTTQDHLEIEGIAKDLIILKNGSLALVLQVSAINFGLLSEEEQDATIYAYAGLLNSLSFPIQILIRSVKKDISGYLETLSAQEAKLKKPVYKDRMRKYREFIETTIVEQNVLDKKFYTIIPYQQVSMKKNTPITDELINKAATDLEPKREHLIKQFSKIGLKAKQLNSKQLLSLLYNFYNPETKGQKFAKVKGYEQPIVAPNIEKESPIKSQGTKPLQQKKDQTPKE